MSTFDTLPIILVSAANETLATSVITELIDNDVTVEYNKGAPSPDRVWRLVNKYYSADVRVHILTDDAVLDLNPETVEAHIIYISEDEINEGVACAERRSAASHGAWRDCDVRVLLMESAGPARGAWLAWAADARAELVPRRELPPTAVPAPEPFADEYGMERARAAMHAHPWPNLQRIDRPLQRYVFSPPPMDEMEEELDDEFEPEPEGCSDASSDSELEWGNIESDSETEERFAVERAEAFAAALQALGGSLGGSLGGTLGGSLGGSAPPAGLPRHARLDHAEELVTAFCRALGLDPDTA